MTPGVIQCTKLKQRHGDKAKYVVPCAQPDCADVTHVEVGHGCQVPNIIRARGWSLTGRAAHSRWWCGTHRQKDAR